MAAQTDQQGGADKHIDLTLKQILEDEVMTAAFKEFW